MRKFLFAALAALVIPGSSCASLIGAGASGSMTHDDSAQCSRTVSSAADAMCVHADSVESSPDAAALLTGSTSSRYRETIDGFRNDCGTRVDDALYQRLSECATRIEHVRAGIRQREEDEVARGRKLVGPIKADPKYKNIIDAGYWEDKQELALASERWRQAGHPSSGPVWEARQVKQRRHDRNARKLTVVLKKHGMTGLAASRLSLW